MPDQPTQRQTILTAERDAARRKNRETFLQFAGLAMHAELNTAGAHEEPARALADAAEEHGQTINERIASNAFSLADAMIDEMLRRGIQ